MVGAGFGGLLVVSFESRRAVEMASLIERYGGKALSAPSMREVSLTENPHSLAFSQALQGGRLDAVVLMTGIGTRALVEEITGEKAGAPAPAMTREALVSALKTVTVVARGPKPAKALRELGLTDFVTVPEPNTSREIVETMVAARSLAGLRVAVQEHGAPSVELYEALRAAGAEVTPVAVYRWALPEDTGPLRRGLHALALGEAKVALFTSRAQVDHALAIAAEEGILAAVRGALALGCVGSIGPVCSEALRAEGLPPDVEPEHPKMGHLVKAAAEVAAGVVAKKQA